MARGKRLGREQRRLWNALTGAVRPRDDIISQIDYLLRQGIIDLEQRHRLLAECDREPSDSVLWRRVVDAIVHHNRISAMQEFNMTHQKRPRKRHKRTSKKPTK